LREPKRQAAGHGKLKDHQKLCAGTAGDYSTTFGAGCKDRGHKQPNYSCYHINPLQWKKIRQEG